MERKFLRTRTPSFEIPKQLQEALVKETLFPDLTLPDKRITPKMRLEAKELIDLSLEGKLNITQQIRVFDPRVRCLPVIPGSSETTASLKQAVHHTNFVITNATLIDTQQVGKDIKRILGNVLRTIISEARKFSCDLDKIRETMLHFTIQGFTVEELLNHMKDLSTTEVKFARSLFEIPDDLESERDGFTTCPHLSNVRQNKKWSQVSLHFWKRDREFQI